MTDRQARQTEGDKSNGEVFPMCQPTNKGDTITRRCTLVIFLKQGYEHRITLLMSLLANSHGQYCLDL